MLEISESFGMDSDLFAAGLDPMSITQLILFILRGRRKSVINFRGMIKLGHDARIMDSRLVAPYRHSGRVGKNDRNDAEAICEAVGRPNMRFVPVKSEESQAVLTVHRVRESVVAERTGVANQMRGLLMEFGIVIPKGLRELRRTWGEVLKRHAERLPFLGVEEFRALFARLLELDARLAEYDRKIARLARASEAASRLMRIEGIGPITASGVVATVSDAKLFKNGRQFAAWLGLTPRQYSTGGKTRLGRISKRGDRYLRTLLVHGARSMLLLTAKKLDRKSRWAEGLKARKPWNKVAVALAAKHARILWAMLARGDIYRP
ncbi:MAG: IS110 family transposase, partial [Gammaproteobacteria bacterium]